MRSLPRDLPEHELIASLEGGWGLDVARARYVPIGFGSYHWDVMDAAGRRYFVTVDDLDAKAWLGDDRDSAFDGLRAAFDTALALRRDAGLAFVVAPIATPGGESVRRAGPRHSAALFPFVGASGRSGMGHTAALRPDLVRLLADLHGATGVAGARARRRHLELPNRARLEAALGELDEKWSGGPFSEPVRDLLAGHAAQLHERLGAFDRLAGEVAAADGDFVISHGEPHAGNVLLGAGEVFLVDWDTVGLAPPERDLWLVGGDAGELALYTEITGRPVDPAAIELYRQRWALDDISAFTTVLRSPHAHTADTEKAWTGLCLYVLGRTAPVRSQST